jgi:hypothetical protein
VLVKQEIESVGDNKDLALIQVGLIAEAARVFY